MRCEQMIEFERAEIQARDLLCETEGNVDIQAMYAQWALDAGRAQRLHIEHCAVCADELRAV